MLDFFLTECGMPVNIPTPEWRLTALHLLVSLKRTETEVFPIVTWLVEEKGADVTCVNKRGYMPAQMARVTGKLRLHNYLQAREKTQAARKAKENKKEEERKMKAAESATMARRLREAEEGMAALLLELEAEEEAEKQAAEDKKKEGKASGGKKKKKK